MKERTLRFTGYSFGRAVYIQHFNMSLITGRQETEQKWLLLFNADSDTATIDYGMPDWYAKIAILAEAIANDKIRRSELSFFRKNNTSPRMVAEQYCLTKVGERRKTWLEARKYFYNVQINRESEPAKKKPYEEALSFIEETIAKEDGTTVEYLKCKEGFFETRYALTDFTQTTMDERHKWLVYFTDGRKVFLDEFSPKWYRGLASLAEEMAMAHKYSELLSNYDNLGADYHSARVEMAIIDKFTSGKRRKEYIEARIALFKLLFDEELNTSEDVKNALEFLLEYQKENP